MQDMAPQYTNVHVCAQLWSSNPVLQALLVFPGQTGTMMPRFAMLVLAASASALAGARPLARGRRRCTHLAHAHAVSGTRSWAYPTRSRDALQGRTLRASP